jgi:outer membrane lipoprotein-sorting protein
MIMWTKIRIALGITAGVLAASGAITWPPANDGSSDAHDDSQVPKIIQDSLAAYAALSSYSDTGKTVSESNGKSRTNTFSILLARTDLYKIEWAESNMMGSTIASRGAVWSVGEGDFLVLTVGDGRFNSAPQKMESPAMAIAGAFAVSAGASSTVPVVFFDIELGVNRLRGLTEPVQQNDEKIGMIDCYVLKSRQIHNGTTNTTSVWIGKQDKLIHQMKRLDERASATPIPPDLEGAAKEAFQRAVQLTKTYTCTETHENISVNKTFKKTDFVHEEQVIK